MGKSVGNQAGAGEEAQPVDKWYRIIQSGEPETDIKVGPDEVLVWSVSGDNTHMHVEVKDKAGLTRYAFSKVVAIKGWD